MEKKKKTEETEEVVTAEAAETASEAAEAAEEAPAEMTEEQRLNEALAKAAEELAKCQEQYRRMLAEYDNYRKRTQKEKEGIYGDGVAQTVGTFLPVLDNLERAVAQETEDTAYKKGVEMTLGQFRECLEKLKVKEIAAEGEQFDPGVHNAVMHVEDESCDENTVVEVFQKGFKLDERVVRHAMVKVAN